MSKLLFKIKAIKTRTRLNKVKRDSESQKRFGHRNTTTSSNKLKDTPLKHEYHLEDYNRQCVYLHYYNNEKLPFYVGTGTLQRAFVFSGTRRNSEYNDKAENVNLINVEIYKLDVSIKEGVEIEAELINKYKFIDDGGSLVNVIIGRGGYVRKSPNPCAKAVIQLDRYNNVIKTWDSITLAGKELKLNSSDISKACNPKYSKKTCGGFKWNLVIEDIVSL